MGDTSHQLQDHHVEATVSLVINAPTYATYDPDLKGLHNMTADWHGLDCELLYSIATNYVCRQIPLLCLYTVKWLA